MQALAVLAWTGAVALAKDAGEIEGIVVTNHLCHLEDGQLGIGQQMRGAVQTQAHGVFVGGDAVFMRKAAAEMGGGKTGFSGDVLQGKRFTVVGLEVATGFFQAWVVAAGGNTADDGAMQFMPEQAEDAFDHVEVGQFLGIKFILYKIK